MLPHNHSQTYSKTSDLNKSMTNDSYETSLKMLDMWSEGSLYNDKLKSRTVSEDKAYSRQEHKWIVSNEITLPAIKEFRAATTLKEKRNMYERHVDNKPVQSLLGGARNLQNFIIYEKVAKKANQKYNVKVWLTDTKCNKHSKSHRKGANSVCPFTEAKLINKIYVKNIIPNIDRVSGEYKRKRRTKKVKKLSKNNITIKSQMKDLSINCV